MLMNIESCSVSSRTAVNIFQYLWKKFIGVHGIIWWGHHWHLQKNTFLYMQRKHDICLETFKLNRKPVNFIKKIWFTKTHLYSRDVRTRKTIRLCTFDRLCIVLFPILSTRSTLTTTSQNGHLQHPLSTIGLDTKSHVISARSSWPFC